MPSVVRLLIVPQQATTLLSEHCPAQGWFLKLAAHAAFMGWSDRLHEGDGFRPYGVAPLYHLGTSTAEPLPSLRSQDSIGPLALSSRVVAADKPLCVRIGLAHDWDARHLCAALVDLQHDLPDLGSAPVRLLRLPVFPSTGGSEVEQYERVDDVWHASWSTLARVAHDLSQCEPEALRLHIRFTTPTAFGRKGTSQPEPDPRLILESWLRSWRFSMQVGDASENSREESFSYWAGLEEAFPAGRIPLPLPLPLRVVNFSLQTRALTFSYGSGSRTMKVPWVGFEGHAELSWEPSASPALRQAVYALAGIADFLGTGAKTAFGCGQTRVRVVPSPQAASAGYTALAAAMPATLPLTASLRPR